MGVRNRRTNHPSCALFRQDHRSTLFKLRLPPLPQGRSLTSSAKATADHKQQHSAPPQQSAQTASASPCRYSGTLTRVLVRSSTQAYIHKHIPVFLVLLDARTRDPHTRMYLPAPRCSCPGPRPGTRAPRTPGRGRAAPPPVRQHQDPSNETRTAMWPQVWAQTYSKQLEYLELDVAPQCRRCEVAS